MIHNDANQHRDRADSGDNLKENMAIHTVKTIKQELLEQAELLENEAVDGEKQAERHREMAVQWDASAVCQRRKSAEYRKLAATLPE